MCRSLPSCTPPTAGEGKPWSRQVLALLAQELALEPTQVVSLLYRLHNEARGKVKSTHNVVGNFSGETTPTHNVVGKYLAKVEQVFADLGDLR